MHDIGAVKKQHIFILLNTYIIHIFFLFPTDIIAMWIYLAIFSIANDVNFIDPVRNSFELAGPKETVEKVYDRNITRHTETKRVVDILIQSSPRGEKRKEGENAYACKR